MYLAGQRQKDSSRPPAAQAGYAMAALLVGLAIISVMMTVAMPVWKQMVQREKEEELVFRGEQIAHAIGMFQRKFANTSPPSLDVLVEQKFLRRKYTDPITNEDFVLIRQSQGVPGAPGTAPAARGAQPQGRRGDAPPAPSLPGRFGALPGGGFVAPGGPAAGIIGVASKSTDTSIRLYKGRSHYNEWAFVYTAPARPGSATPGAGPGGLPGGNRGNNPARGNAPSPFSSGPGGQSAPGRGGPGRGLQGIPGNPGAPGQPSFPSPGGPGRGR